MTTMITLIIVLFLFSTSIDAFSIENTRIRLEYPVVTMGRVYRGSDRFSLFCNANNDNELNFNLLHGNRRHVLQTMALLPTLNRWCTPTMAYAVDNSQALMDLPALPSDQVRIYLCRHGETENNRLRLIQGARVDPPLNDVGIRQATRLGQALAMASVVPTDMFHSPLVRARQTAQIANDQIPTRPTLRVLPSLSEVDFGSLLEGKPVEQYRADMVATYTAWSFGKLDTRMDDNGESGYEVRLRC
jgi:hypothetical protein